MTVDRASRGDLARALARVGQALDAHADSPPYDTSAYPDAPWAAALRSALPHRGWGADRVLDLLSGVVIEHGMPADQGGFCGWIFTAPPDVPAAAQVVASRVGSQRYMEFANAELENLALAWLAELFGLSTTMDGVFSSSGTTANILALAAARQKALEGVGIDPALDGLSAGPIGTLYGSVEAHHCVIKAAGALGLGRRNVRLLESDSWHRLDPDRVRAAIAADRRAGMLPIAVIANAGSTNTGSIDPIATLADLCAEQDVWLHVDGAYGLPGMLDERVAERFAGVERADSVVMDPHKWLNVPTGTAVTFVRHRGLLARALTGEPSEYIEGQFGRAQSSSAWDTMGPPFHEMSLELSAVSRGLVVWAALAEIGRDGFAARIRRHRDCARVVHDRATAHPRLESLVEPELSVACFRYVGGGLVGHELDAVNAEILSRLRLAGTHMPSGSTVDGVFVIRPCYISSWSNTEHAAALVDAVVTIGDEICGG